MDPFGATSKLPSSRAWAEGLGLLIWMIGLWLVAARYAFKAIRPIKPNAAAITAPDHGGSRRLTSRLILGP